MRRCITLAILIIISFVLQTSILSFGSLTHMAPDLCMILTMSFGIMRGRREGMLVGFFSGFLMDVYFSTLIGPYMILYLFIGYINGTFHKNYVAQDVMLPVIIITIDEFIVNTIIYIISFLIRNRTDFWYYLTRVTLPRTLFTLLATLVLYRFYIFVNRTLKKKAKAKS